jgi:hypothetical protein
MTTKIPVELSSTPGIVDGSNATAITIDSSENVAIGRTSNIAHPLDIQRADNAYIRISSGTTQENAGIIFANQNSTKWTLEKEGSAHSLFLKDASSTAVTFAQGGNVGIGTTSPTSPNDATDFLHIGSASNQDTSIVLQDAVEIWEIYQNDNLSFRFDTTAVMTLERVTGNVAISAGNFYVSGEGTSFSAGSHNGNLLDDNGQSISSRAATNNQTHKSFYNPNGAVGSITTNGSATAYNTSSDYRLKENVVTDWDGTTLLKQLKPSKFNFISDADTTLQGFLAHEVSSIVPQAVSGEKDAVYSAEDVAENIGAVEGQPNYQSIDHSKLVPLLVKTIQELEARITTLEGE